MRGGHLLFLIALTSPAAADDADSDVLDVGAWKWTYEAVAGPALDKLAPTTRGATCWVRGRTLANGRMRAKVRCEPAANHLLVYPRALPATSTEIVDRTGARIAITVDKRTVLGKQRAVWTATTAHVDIVPYAVYAPDLGPVLICTKTTPVYECLRITKQEPRYPRGSP